MGEITIRITGGTKPYDIELLGVPPTPDHPVSWTVNYDPPFDFILDDVEAGNYQVKVTDSNRCEDTSSGRIIVINPCECETVMTVGEASYEDPMAIIKGYNIIETDEMPIIGSLSPNCESVLSLVTISVEESSFLAASQLIIPYSESYPSVKVVYVNDFPYYLYCLGVLELESSQFIGYYSADHLPFPDEEETCDIRICNEEVPECFDTILTVGEAPEVYPIGTMGYSNFLINFGELSPAHNISAIVISPEEELTVLTVVLFNDLSSVCPTLTIEIDETEYELTLLVVEGFIIYMGGSPENPLPAIGETCTVRICNTQCTTTTTTTEEPTTTTTTTTLECNILCETTMTVGELNYSGGMYYGYMRDDIWEEVGSINPECNDNFGMLEWEEPYNRLRLYWLNSNPCNSKFDVYIDNEHYEFTNQHLNNDWSLDLSYNPFPSTGQTCSIIICGNDCTTTTTTTLS